MDQNQGHERSNGEAGALSRSSSGPQRHNLVFTPKHSGVMSIAALSGA
jgi:hypothetical protein